MLLAIFLAPATIVYSFAWMYYIRFRTPVELGLRMQLVSSENSVEIVAVEAGSAAEQAGIRAQEGDIAVHGGKIPPAGSSLLFFSSVAGVHSPTHRLPV